MYYIGFVSGIVFMFFVVYALRFYLFLKGTHKI